MSYMPFLYVGLITMALKMMGGTVLKFSEIFMIFGKLYDKINNIKIKYIIKCKINYKI